MRFSYLVVVALMLVNVHGIAQKDENKVLDDKKSSDFNLIIKDAFKYLTNDVTSKDVQYVVKYNDRIVYLNDLILNTLESLIDSYNEYIPSEMDSLYANALLQIDFGINKIKRLAPFRGDLTFKNETLKLFIVYEKLLKKRHSRIIEILKLPEKDYKKEQMQEFEKHMYYINETTNKAINNLRIIQEQFAEKYNIQIVGEEE